MATTLEYQKLTWRDVFTQPEGAEPLSEADQRTLDAYLSAFAHPESKDGHALCIGCGASMRGGIDGYLLGGADGNATWEWSLAHGECHCSRCGYPARALHYDIGGTGEDALIRKLTLTLQYHPEPRHQAGGLVVSEWQPIATANEGELVLVHDDGYVGKAMLMPDGRWLDTECGREDAYFDPPPTEWMPLPDPPAGSRPQEPER